MRRASLIMIICLLVVACNADRSKLTPHEALMGHWVQEMGDTEYYFSKNQMIRVDEGEAVGFEYSVLVNNPPDGIVLRVEPVTDDPMARVFENQILIVFERDKMQALADSQIGISGSFVGQKKIWRYKGPKQKP